VVGVLRRPRPAAEGHSRDGGPTRLLFVGRGIPNKAQRDLVLALAAMRHTPLDAQLTLIGAWGGAEAYEAHCRELAARLRLGDRLRILGSVGDATLAQAYADADLFLCLSDHEGYCVPVVEAMEAGLPVVAYAAGAVPETLGAGGLLLEDKSPSLVAEAVAETLRNDALRERMAEGRRAQLAELSHEATAARLRAFVATLT
jgi:glycosyltransferase involved in cell wall biosynthesis